MKLDKYMGMDVRITAAHRYADPYRMKDRRGCSWKARALPIDDFV
jgi:hypothetical protein